LLVIRRRPIPRVIPLIAFLRSLNISLEHPRQQPIALAGADGEVTMVSLPEAG